MEPIFDRHGEAVAWLREDIIFDAYGNARALIRGEQVYNYSATTLGTHSRGYFRDRRGQAVAFTRGASGGPMLPIPAIPPIPPIPGIPPIPPIPPILPVPPIPRVNVRPPLRVTERGPDASSGTRAARGR